MGYDQWVTFRIVNKGRNAVKVANVKLSWGKFYANEDKSQEVASPAGDIIQSGAELKISSCGRSDSASGTEGRFQLVDFASGRVVTTINWDCPYIGRNKLSVTTDNREWLVVKDRDAKKSGPLGNFVITLSAA